MADNIKQFLNTWCSKNHKQSPVYNVTSPMAGGRGQRIRFKCEVTVEGFSYVGFGSSSNKKDSQTNAARDFTNFLVREKVIDSCEIPTFSRNELVGNTEEQAPVQPYMLPRSDIHDSNDMPNTRSNYIMNIFDQKKLEEAEDVDFTSDIHGGWSLENAKSNLHMYMQKNKITSDYKYSTAGPDHNKSFIAELTIYCPQLKRNINSREAGSNKQSASKACALSAIRQLYHLKVVEAYNGVTTKTKSEQIPPFKVNVDPNVELNIDTVIENLGLIAVEKNECVTGEEEINLIVNYSITDFEPQLHHRPQIISWAPALPNWNAWISCNIDEGEEAFLSLDEISRRMKDNFLHRRSSEPELQKMLHEREQLPASSYERAIVETIFDHQIVMIRGETGSGKTTQVPQFILDYFIQLNRGAECNIIVTQPRRISAVALAERVAQERGESLGQSCGYSVRFDTILPQPYGGIFYCTVGTLLRKVEGGLRGVSHIIVDEIHERDCNTDFLLILLRDMAAAYPSLKIILMSATIDVQLFKNFFPDLYCLELEGRSFPVNHYFLEDIIEMTAFDPGMIVKKDKKGRGNDGQDGDEILTTKGDETDVNCNWIIDETYKQETKRALSKLSEKEISFEIIETLLKYIENIHTDGAVLIFLPGWNLIQMLLKQLSKSAIYGSSRFVLLALHSQVPREEQRKAFRPCRPGVRKIILATNIAETSITINDVMFVIDSCRAKIKMFTSRNNLTSYNTVWASKTNLEQRRGRAGRVREGYAFHLCSRARYDRLEIHQTPEILRTALHEIALMIKLLKLGDTKQFLGKAIEQPPIDAVIEAEHLLREMKAFDKNDELTPLGRILARLPIEPRIGKMIIYGCLFGVTDACATIAACTSLGDPFVIPPERKRLSRQQVDLAGGRCSDHVAILNAFQKWDYAQMKGQMSEEMFCESKGLNLSILKMTKEAAMQIKNILSGAGFPEQCLSPQFFEVRKPCTGLDNVINLLVLGLYPNVCYHKDKRKVLTTEGKAALIHKSSVNCSNFILTFPSPFFIFGEKMRTRVIACKQMSMINPLQLLMFGARKVTYQNQMIVVDDWLNLDMDFKLAAKVLALRPALESLLVKACINPEMVMSPQEDDIQLMDIVTRLSDPNVCYHGGKAPISGGIPDNRKRPGFNEPRQSNYAAAPLSSYAPRGQSSNSNYRPPIGNSFGQPRMPATRGFSTSPIGMPMRQKSFDEEIPSKFKRTDSFLDGPPDSIDSFSSTYGDQRGQSLSTHGEFADSPAPNVGWADIPRNNGARRGRPAYPHAMPPYNNPTNNRPYGDYPADNRGSDYPDMGDNGDEAPQYDSGFMHNFRRGSFARPQYPVPRGGPYRNFGDRQAPMNRGRW